MMTLVGGNVEREESLVWKQGREGVTKLDGVEERDAMEKKNAAWKMLVLVMDGLR